MRTANGIKKVSKFQKFVTLRGQISGGKLGKVDGESGKIRKRSEKSQGIPCQKFGRHPAVCLHCFKWPLAEVFFIKMPTVFLKFCLCY